VIIVCPCSQRLRVHLGTAHRARCPICRRMVGAEAARQAARNAAIVLEVARHLHARLDRPDATPAEETIAAIFERHEREARA